MATVRRNMETCSRLGIALLLIFGSEMASALPSCPSNWDSVNCQAVLHDPLNSPIALDYYTKNSTFFQVHASSEIPGDLRWEDGSNLESFADPHAQKGGTLIVPLDVAPTSFRTYGDNSMMGRLAAFYQNGVQMPFTMRHPTTRERIPGLAARWAVSSDHRSVFFELDNAAEFQASWIKENSHLGTPEQKFPKEPINSGNVFYGFYLIKNDILDSWLHNMVETYFDSVHIYSQRVVEIRFKGPDFTALADASQLVMAQPRLFFGPLEKTSPDAYSELYQWSFPASAGPYAMISLDDFSLGRTVTLRRVKNWWGEKRKFNQNRFNPDSIIFKVSRLPAKSFETVGMKDSFSFLKIDASDYYSKVENNTHLLQRIDRGELDLHEYSPNVPFSRRGIHFNLQNDRLKDAELRKGLSLVFNYDAVNAILFHNDGTRIMGANSGFGPFDSPQVAPPSFNPNEASKIFESLGYRRNPKGIFEHPQKGLLAFTITTYAQWGFPIECSQLSEHALKAGVLLQCEILDKGLAVSKTALRQHELSLINRSNGDSEVPLYGDLKSELAATTTQSPNFSNVADVELDALINQYNLETNQEKLQKLSQQIQERFFSWNAFIPSVEDRRYFILADKSVHFVDPGESFFEDPFQSNTYWIESSR